MASKEVSMDRIAAPARQRPWFAACTRLLAAAGLAIGLSGCVVYPYHQYDPYRPYYRPYYYYYPE
ncbi:MAG: hypothetical protein JO104_11215 [Candidatus Eremiobacteraeota bacterium]|nr:hypothetical protein [Candidatus Eremiobacteraeota bacterium]